MKIGIVGGNGFIGRYLYDRIKRFHNEYKVVIFDINKSDDIPEADFVYLDVTNPNSFADDIFRNYDVIYYKTGAMGPGPSFDNPILFYQLNLEGAMRTIGACLNSNIGQFVYASTESVFGIRDIVPFREDQKPNPSSIYGVTKAVCEEYIRYIAQSSKMNLLIFRYPRIISGKNQNIFNTLITKLRKEEEIEVTANGEKKFDIVHIDDVIDWNIWLLKNKISTTLHVTSGFQIDILNLIEILYKKISNKANYRKVKISDKRSTNDILLPDSLLLDNKKSLDSTCLNIKYDRISKFIDSML